MSQPPSDTRQRFRSSSKQRAHIQARPYLWAVLGVVVAIQLYYHDLNSKQPLSKIMEYGTGLDEPRVLNLDNTSLSSVLSSESPWTLVFFGFTECPGICPTTMRALAQEYGALLENRKFVEVVFISVDSQKDTPEIAQSFAATFNETFKGVVLQSAESESVASQFATLFGPSDDPAHRLMHGSHIYLVKNQKIYGTFSVPFEKGKLTEDLRQIVLRSRI